MEGQTWQAQQAQQAQQVLQGSSGLGRAAYATTGGDVCEVPAGSTSAGKAADGLCTSSTNAIHQQYKAVHHQQYTAIHKQQYKDRLAAASEHPRATVDVVMEAETAVKVHLSRGDDVEGNASGADNSQLSTYLPLQQPAGSDGPEWRTNLQNVRARCHYVAADKCCP